jgi:phosphoglycolate phosphatase
MNDSMNKRFDLIVFDWDGTLMDSTATIASSIQLACRDLGLAPPDDARARHVIGLGLADALAYAAPSLLPEQLPQMIERYRQHYLSRDHALVLFPEVREMIVELKEAGYFVAVATGKNRGGLNRALDQSGLKPFFDATRCADESFSKPHPQMLLDLSDQLGVELNRTLMIGDTTHDLQMAANAGSHALGVSYGAHPLHELMQHASLGVVDSSVALRTWLKTQGAQATHAHG